jgi:integrase
VSPDPQLNTLNIRKTETGGRYSPPARRMDARTVSDRLGHSSSSFTMNTYVHPAEQAQRRAARRADGMFAKTGRNVL